MTTVTQGYGANAAVNMTPALTGLTNGSISISDEIDNSAGHLNDDIEIIGTTDAGATGGVDVYYIASNVTGVYASTDVVNNLKPLTSMDITGSAPKEFERITQLPEFYKLVVINKTGVTLGTTTLNHKVADLSNA